MPTLHELLAMDGEEQQQRGVEHTPREIAQQPHTWSETLSQFERERPRLQPFLEQLGLRGPLENRPVVILIGAGTSDYIGGALEALLRRQWQCDVQTIASTELLLGIAAWLVPGRAHLFVSFSRSGNSPEGVAVLEQALAHHPGIAHLVVTCSADARMVQLLHGARNACSVVLADAVNDRSLAMTSSFTNMVVFGQCLAHTWDLDTYRPLHARLVRSGQQALTSAAHLAHHIAETDVRHVCFVGSGPLASIARESALKLLEMTAGEVATTYETILGLRHGPLAALTPDTLLVCLVPADERGALFARDLLRELGLKRVVRERIALGPAAVQPLLAADADTFLVIDDAPSHPLSDQYSTVVDVLFGQLLGLLCSVARGRKPDAPSPGNVITRVVQPFTIH